MTDSFQPDNSASNEPRPEGGDKALFKPQRVIHPPKVKATATGNRLRPWIVFRDRLGTLLLKLIKPRKTDLPQGKPVPVNAVAVEPPMDGKLEGRDGTSEPLNPGQRLRDLENAGKIPPEPQLPTVESGDPVGTSQTQTGEPLHETRLIPGNDKKPRTFRDIAPGLSLIINLILIVVVILLAIQFSSLKKTTTALLGGLYDNFVRMDNSSIMTIINMSEVPIPVNFNLPVTQPETSVTLTRPVTVQGARVSISSGALTIDNAPATVTLPAGTILPVALQMEVPVQTTLYASFQVPVNIRVADASLPGMNVDNLHLAITGLQDAIGPLFCQINPKAQDYLNNALCNAQGEYIPRSPLVQP